MSWSSSGAASGGEEGGHHGGVWKIAYADFMTAMMAFFLVMWLINSTDQKVLTQVANYFNPMRLTDSTPHSRGINTIESGEQGKQGKHEFGRRSQGEGRSQGEDRRTRRPRAAPPREQATPKGKRKARARERPKAKARAARARDRATRLK